MPSAAVTFTVSAELLSRGTQAWPEREKPGSELPGAIPLRATTDPTEVWPCPEESRSVVSVTPKLI